MPPKPQYTYKYPMSAPASGINLFSLPPSTPSKFGKRKFDLLMCRRRSWVGEGWGGTAGGFADLPQLVNFPSGTGVASLFDAYRELVEEIGSESDRAMQEKIIGLLPLSYVDRNAILLTNFSVQTADYGGMHTVSQWGVNIERDKLEDIQKLSPAEEVAELRIVTVSWNPTILDAYAKCIQESERAFLLPLQCDEDTSNAPLALQQAKHARGNAIIQAWTDLQATMLEQILIEDDDINIKDFFHPHEAWFMSKLALYLAAQSITLSPLESKGLF